MESKFDKGGFTLIELLACGLILSLAAIGILNLVRLSDAAAVRGKLDSQAGLIFREVVYQISSYPFEEFWGLVDEARDFGPNGAVFSYGNERALEKFPFLEEDGGDPSDRKYLFYGKPVPGSSEPNGMYPYELRVEAKPEGGDPPRFFTVSVTMSWKGFRDRLVDGKLVPSERSISIRFQKWDASVL